MARTKDILTAAGTLLCALGIGFFMQQSDAAKMRYGNVQDESEREVETWDSSNTYLEFQKIILTSAVFDTDIDYPTDEGRTIGSAAPYVLVTPEPENTAFEGTCEITAHAQPVAAAMVDLTLDASCLPNEQVTVHHNGMIFTETTSADGTLELTAPALTAEAVYVFSFADGAGAVAQASVADLEDFDRVVLQWRGQIGFQIHALEFDANYESAGHIWEGAPGAVAKTVMGYGGMMARYGDVNVPNALVAEVYTFPNAATTQHGTVKLNVEAEVTDRNCGLEIEAQSIEIISGGKPITRDLTLSVPDCDTTGDFLVLNNLLQDLKVASK